MRGDPDDALDLVGQAERFGVSCRGVFFACDYLADPPVAYLTIWS